MSKNIMIVDDSAIMRRIIADMIGSFDDLAVCACAPNGAEALAQLKTAKPDLILLDIEMPVMNGLELLRHLKLRSPAKVIILSSVTGLGSEKAAQAIKLGADAIISKPSGAISMDLKKKCSDQLRHAIHCVLDAPTAEHKTS